MDDYIKEKQNERYWVDYDDLHYQLPTIRDFELAKRTSQDRLYFAVTPAKTDDIRKKNVEIYKKRFELGLDLWTGNPLFES